MNDINLNWTGDLSLSPTGDIALVSGPPLGTQRVLRRLMSNPGDYIWHPEYGAGLGSFVGYPVNPAGVMSLVLSQMSFETAVAQSPEPVIASRSDVQGHLYLDIRYADAETATPLSVSLTVGEPS